MNFENGYFSLTLKNSAFRFNSAHFLLQPLEPLHGHNYRVSLKIKGNNRLTDGMITNYNKIINILTQNCDELNNKVLLPFISDLLSIKIEDYFISLEEKANPKNSMRIPSTNCLLLNLSEMTAEKLAQYLLEKLLKDIELNDVDTSNMQKLKMTVFENDGCSANFSKKISI